MALERQEAIGKLAKRMTAVEKETPRQIDALRDELHGHVATEIEEGTRASRR